MARSLVVRNAGVLLLTVAIGACCRLPLGNESSSPDPILDRPGSTSGASTTQQLDPQTGSRPVPTNTVPTGQEYQANGFPVSMPKVRTAVPTVEEWGRAPVITTKQFPRGCSMKFVREWLKINCSKDTGTDIPKAITGAQGMGGRGADYFEFSSSGRVIDIVVRTQNNHRGTALFVTDRRSYTVGFDWPNGAPFPSTIWQ